MIFPAQQTHFAYGPMSRENRQAIMDEWEYFRIAVSYRENGRIDFVAKKDKDPSSIATHGGMKAHFNVMRSEWETFLQRLGEEGWELINVDKNEDGRNETYNFKRVKE